MKVLHLVGTLNAGGIERVVSQLALTQKQGGDVEPVIACLLRREGLFLDELVRSGVQVYDCSYSGKAPWVLSIRLIKLIRHVKPDLIHSHVNFSLLWQAIPKFLFSLPFVYTQHSISVNARKLSHRIMCFLGYCVVSKSKFKHTAVSDFAATYASRLYRTQKEGISIIYNGISPEMFKFDKVKRGQIRANYQIAKDEIVLGCVGRLDYVKGYDILIDAFSRLIFRVPNRKFRLMIVGDGTLKNTLIAQSEVQGIADNVVWVGKIHEVADHLSAMDIYVQASRWETLSLTILEALANGLNVLTSDSSGSSEISQYVNGVHLFHGHEIEEIISEITELLHLLPREEFTIVEFSELFHVNTMTKRYLEIYDSLQSV